MTTAIFIVLNFLDRLAGAVRRVFVRQSALTPEEIQQRLDAGIVEIRRKFHEKFEEVATSCMTAKVEHDAAAQMHREAAARHDAETESLRVLVNLGVAKVLTRGELYRTRN
jgi:hypothetical protein